MVMDKRRGLLMPASKNLIMGPFLLGILCCVLIGSQKDAEITIKLMRVFRCPLLMVGLMVD